MPFPIALAGAVASFAGNAQNSASQQRMNDQSMYFSREMYERQKRDNIEFWNMQNAYNSPAAQMKRFQEANLNPHLIYGQGNSGNASPVTTPDVQSPQFRSPEWGNAISGGGLTLMNAIYDLDIKAAQIDNLETQNTVLLQEELYKRAQIKATMTAEERARFDLELESELRPISLEARKTALHKTKTDIDLSINEDTRRAALNASNVQEAAERIASMREQRANTRAERERIRETIQSLKRDNVLKDLDIELRKQGINPNDPMWARIVGRILANYFDETGTWRGDIWDRKK